MIDALEMDQVGMEIVPHPSHRMTEWKSTVVACASNDRFGQIRECSLCEARDVKAGGAGSHYVDAYLLSTCLAPKPTNQAR